MADTKIDTVLAVLVVGMLAMFSYNQGVFSSWGIAPSPESQAQQPTQTVKIEGACGVDSTTLTAVMQKKYAASTSMASENVTIVVNGAEKSTKKTTQTETVNPSDNVELYFGLESGTYYTNYAKGVIPCKGAMDTSDPAFTPSGAYQLYQMDAATTSIFSLINDPATTTNPATAQAMGAGSSKNLKLTLSPTYEDGLGIPCGNVLSCQYNTSAYNTDSGLAVRLTDGGVELSPATNPTNTLWASISTDHTRKSWQLPKFDGKAVTTKEYGFSLKAGDTNEVTAGGGDVNCTIWDSDYYRNDNGGYACGIEDLDDNSDVGLTSNTAAFNFGTLVS